MARFLLKVFAFLLPLVGGLGWMEYRLQSIPTRFTDKREVLDTAGPGAQILVLGNSHGNADLNPARLPCPGVNLANDSQTLDVDLRMLEKVAPSMPRLELVVVPVSYVSLRGRLQDNRPMAWRIPLYRKVFGVDVEGRTAPWEWMRDTAIARYTLRDALGVAARGFTREPRDTDSRGWTPDPVKAGMTSDPEMRKRAVLHRRAASGIRPDLVEALGGLVDVSRRANARIVLVAPPLTRGYVEAWPERDRVEFVRFMTAFARERGVTFVDYTLDARFQEVDFADADHLSPEGADRFSAILTTEVLGSLVACQGDGTPGSGP
jgi:hypothetical protein